MKSVLVILGNLVLTQVGARSIERDYRVVTTPVNVKKEIKKPKTQLIYRSGRFEDGGGWLWTRDIKKPTPKYVHLRGRRRHSERQVLGKPAVYKRKYSVGGVRYSGFIFE